MKTNEGCLSKDISLWDIKSFGSGIIGFYVFVQIVLYTGKGKKPASD
jgi:hypothetical protein